MQTENIGHFVSGLYRKNQLYLNQALKGYDLSPTEMLVLYHLCSRVECSQEDSQEVVAAHMMIDKAAITRTVQALEKKGWLIREKSQTDKRSMILKPQQKAYDAQAEFRDIMCYWTKFLTEGMDEERIDHFFETLTMMYDLVKNTDLSSINEKRQAINKKRKNK